MNQAPNASPSAPASGGTPPNAQASAGRLPWGIVTAIGIGTFMSALDGSVVNTIQPILVPALKSNVATIQWVLTVYLLVVSGLLLGMGRWGDLYGHKQVFLVGFGIFVVASVLCGLAPSAELLIAFRVLQAVGAAMLFASGPAIVAQNVAPQRRGQALGLQLTMAYVGLTLGPLLGGWLAKNFGWGSVFFINVPVGLPALWLAWRVIPDERGAEQGKRFDLAGATLFMLGLTAMLLALNKGYAWGWRSPNILGLLVLAGVLLGLFLWVEARLPDPMLDLGLFRNRLFSFAGISAVLCYVGLYSTLFLLPYYLIDGRRMEPDQAGLILCAQPLAMAGVASFSGAVSDRIGTRWPTTAGMLILALGLYLLSRLQPETSIAFVVLGLALAGLGTGMFVSPNNSAMLGAVSRERRGIASGVMATARNVGMVLGIGMAGAVFTSFVPEVKKVSQNPAGLIAGVHWGFLAACWVALVGSVTSLIRER